MFPFANLLCIEFPYCEARSFNNESVHINFEYVNFYPCSFNNHAFTSLRALFSIQFLNIEYFFRIVFIRTLFGW